jgi:uncharacterized membrane protein YhaH (DUF805 family)
MQMPFFVCRLGEIVMPSNVRPRLRRHSKGEFMLDWMILPFKRYAQFSGRSRRMEYWSFFLLIFLVQAVLYAIMFGTTDMSSMMANTDPANVMAVYGQMFSGIGILIPLFGLATFIPNLAVNVRRLHDRNMSGWFLLLFFVLMLIPLVGFIVAIGYLVLMFLPGTPGPNKYGADPKDAGGAEVFS